MQFRSRDIAGLAVWMTFVISLLAAGLLFGSGEALAQGRGPTAVAVDDVREEPLGQTVPVLGRLVARQSGTIAARIGGAVEEMAVNVGDRVVPGDVLAVLAGQRLTAERDRAEAVVAQRRAKLDGARAELAKTQQEFDRLSELRSSAAFSQARYDDMLQDVAQMRGSLAEGDAELSQAQTQLVRAQLDLEDSQVRAPFAGVVSEKHTDVGAYVNVGSPVVSVINDEDLEIEADVPASRIGGLEPGTVIAVSINGGTTISAIVRAIVPYENPLTRTRPVRLTPALENAGGGLAADQSVTLAVPIGQATTVLTVDKDAILRRPDGATAFVVVDGAAQPRKVQLGDGVGSRFVVLGGLQPGDMVVTRGNETLRPGQEVRIIGDGAPGDGGRPSDAPGRQGSGLSGSGAADPAVANRQTAQRPAGG